MKAVRLTALSVFLALSFALVETDSLRARPSGDPQADSRVSRKDPFESLVAREQMRSSVIIDRPGGIAGLVVNSLRVSGIVKSSRDLIAVVTNPSGRTSF